MLKNRIKIAHVYWSLTNGGIENMLTDIINYQVNSCNVSLFIINDLIDQSILSRIDKRCKTYLLKRKVGSKTLLPIIKLNWLVWKHKFDILHVHSSTITQYIPFFSGRMLGTVHNTGGSKATFSGCTVLACISKAVYDDMNTTKRQGLIEIDNGVNLKLIKQRTNKKQLGVFKIVQVSRLYIKQKGQDILLMALKLLKDQGITNICIDFIGSGESEMELIQMIEKFELDGQVCFLGNCSREYIYSHLCEYDLFVQPSRFEGFGLTVAEAMAAKLPVLVSENEGPLEIIDFGKAGYFFKNKDVADLASKIMMFVSHQNEDLTEVAYNRIKKQYNVETTSQKYIDLYNNMIANKS